MIDKIEYKKLNTLLNKVNRINKEYNKSQIKNGGNFNICSLLRKDNDEVNLHSKFIYELINPNGSHFQGDKFFRLFITEALEIEDLQYTNIKVFREDLTESNRRIDFTIETSNYLIGIEMKIDASDQDKQLLDYYKELSKRNNTNKNKKTVKLFYLTKYGSEASKKSVGALKDYFLLSFSIDIEWWLSKCINQTKIVKLQESIMQYKEVVQKITGQLPKEIEKEMDRLIKNENDIEAIHKLTQDYPRIWAKKEVEFWNKLYTKVNATIINKIKNVDNKNITIDLYSDCDDNFKYALAEDDKVDIIKTNRHHNHYHSFGLQVNYTYKKNNFEMIFYQEDHNCSNIEVTLYGPRGASKENKKLRELLEDLEFIFILEATGDREITNPDVRFYAKDVVNPSFELFEEDKTKLNNYISEYTKIIRSILKTIDENKDNIIK